MVEMTCSACGMDTAPSVGMTAKAVFLLALVACSPLAAGAGEPVAQADDDERPPVPTVERVPVERAGGTSPEPPLFLRPRPREKVVGYEMKRQSGLWLTGALLLGSVYFPNIGVSALISEPLLSLPLVGPLIEIPRIGGDNSGLGAWATSLLAADALLQMGGACMLIVGATTKHAVPIHQTAALAPMLVRSGAGFTVAGRF